MAEQQDPDTAVNPLTNSPEQEETSPIAFKFKDNLFLGSLLPGQSTSVSYYLEECLNDIQFLSIDLDQSSVSEGFCLSKNSKSEHKPSLNVILKPKSTERFVIHIFAPNMDKSTELKGVMKIGKGKETFTVDMYARIEIPRVFCPKFLHNQREGLNLIRITINKLVTNEGRINMVNLEKYPMEFEVEVLGKGMVDKDCPYNLAASPDVITALAEKPFMFSVSISTNIFFKGSMSNLKKVILRKLLLLKTNSSIIYTIPLEIIVVFVKQPEIKE